MLDLKFVVNNVDVVKNALKKRNSKLNIDEIVTLFNKRNELLQSVENMKARKNQASNEISKMMKEKLDTTAIKSEMKVIGIEIKLLDDEIRVAQEKINEIMLSIPNIPMEDVPVGSDDSQNLEMRKFLEPKEFDFEPKAHWDLGEALDITDANTAAKVTGARFNFYKGLGARLERSILNFMMDFHSSNGYTEILPPYLVNTNSMIGTGQLPKFAEDMFHIENSDYYLIPTAEVPVTNMFAGDVLMADKLPLRFAAYSACFRAEAGSAGRDTRGLIRQHQFNKVELVHLALPDQNDNEIEKITDEAEGILKALELPYRVVKLCTGDLGFSSQKTYDIEVYMPSYGRYVEISSCSTFGDFQARRMNLRYKNSVSDKPQYLYTFNGSGLAVGRTTAAIMENYQQADGSIVVPTVLRKYMGVDVIK